jgi:hypothetical protein
MGRLSVEAAGTDTDLAIVDGDLHVLPPADHDIVDRLPERFAGKGLAYPDGNWSSPVGPFRSDAPPEVATDPEVMADRYLDRYGVDHAVITGGGPNLQAAVLPDVGDSSIQPLPVTTVQHHVRPLGGKRPRGGFSETAAGSGHEGGVASELQVHTGPYGGGNKSVDSAGPSRDVETGVQEIFTAGCSYGRDAMSDSDTVDEALKRVREAFDEAADEAEQMTEEARSEVDEAIDSLEERVERLRD